MSCTTIYFNEKPLFICEEIPAFLNKFKDDPQTLWIPANGGKKKVSLFSSMSDPHINRGILFGDFWKNTKKVLLKEFNLVKAGGGIVENDKGEILLIYRRGKWDLPKGKLDEGETIEECAVREVQEETGLQKIQLIRPFTITYHTYEEKGKKILKESHWYLMETPGSQQLTPQAEEQITQAKWIAKKDLEKFFGETYSTIREILEEIISSPRR